MAVKNSKFLSSSLNSAFAPTTAYYQHLSAASAAIAAYEGWNHHLDLLSTQHLTQTSPKHHFDETLQMHHLRFPTPPITPPYNNSAYKTLSTSSPQAISTRTQSVIMKIGQNHHLNTTNMPADVTEHVDDMPVDIVGLDDSVISAEALRHETASRMTTSASASSASSSPKRSEYVCEWIDCGRDHNTLESLAAHVTKVHAVASPCDGLYYCRWQGCTRMRGFSARYKMLVHARTHTKEKPHQCHLCTKSFSRAENLKIHIRSHSGEKPYLCTYEGCNKAYSNSSDRFKHTRTHAMDKPYMCKVPGCQKRYTDPSSLRKHVKTFKHSIQLIGTAAVTPIQNPLIAAAETAQAQTGRHAHLPNMVSAPTLNAAMVTASNQHVHDERYVKGYDSDAGMPVCQLCVPPPQQPHYYLNAMEEDLCNIKAAQLDYYYATTAHSPARSSTASSNCWSSNAQSEENTVHLMESESPLDLRVNRS